MWLEHRMIYWKKLYLHLNIYFFIFLDIVNDIVFLISVFMNCYFIFILYSASLSNSLIGPRHFFLFVYSSGFST